MSHYNYHTNGASLEDCHGNFFALTDICGIKWLVYREKDAPRSSLVPSEDPLLMSYSRCLNNNVLCVWRRVPRGDSTRVNSFGSFDLGGDNSTCEDNNLDPLLQRKELWIFWYGERPDERIKKLVDLKRLQEVTDVSGSWENGLPYEARTLLYKALNNLIERNLVRKGFVRFGKWFVLPLERRSASAIKSSSSFHLSFSFQYFVHGESVICAAVDVKQHPAVYRVNQQHLTMTREQSKPITVILAPFGLSATLTGKHLSCNDPAAKKILNDWNMYYPLDRSPNKYISLNGKMVTTMPDIVEVNVAGCKVLYPTGYVFVVDSDDGIGKHDFDVIWRPVVDAFNVEPSPFTANGQGLLKRDVAASSEMVSFLWQDVLFYEAVLRNPVGISVEGGASAAVNMPPDYHSHWDLASPARIRRTKNRNKPAPLKEKLRERSKYCGKAVFHKKVDAINDITSAFEAEFDIKNSTYQLDQSFMSPVSVASPVVLSKNPASIKAFSISAPSPYYPQSNGQITPVDIETKLTPKPCTVMTPTMSYGDNDNVKNELECKMDLGSSSFESLKRYSLPIREYETEMANEPRFSDNIYDQRFLRSWLDHPVKKFRPLLDSNEVLVGEDGLSPMYRRNSELYMFSDKFEETASVHSKRLNLSEFQRNNQPLNFEDAINTNKIQGDSTMLNSSSDPAFIKIENKQQDEDKTDWRSADGLRPSMADLDHLFDNSSNDAETAAAIAPTPPGSNKPPVLYDDLTAPLNPSTTVVVSGPADFFSTKLMAKSSNKLTDPIGNLPHDQLAKMFPTPPSHEHNIPLASPIEIEHSFDDIKQEVNSPIVCGDEELVEMKISATFVPSSKFASLLNLPSMSWSQIPRECYYNQSHSFVHSRFNCVTREQLGTDHTPLNGSFASVLPHSVTPISAPNSISTPHGTPGHKSGMSPISPYLSSPRSHHSVHHISSPASVPSSFYPSKNGVESLNVGQSTCNKDEADVDALVLNMTLSDSLLNVFRDHNFDSCTMCVCNNEGNIRGRDTNAFYLPSTSNVSIDDVACYCGYSAIRNRLLSYQSGLFFEDEADVTGLNEFDTRSKQPIDTLRTNQPPNYLLELIQDQTSYAVCGFDSVADERYTFPKYDVSGINIMESMDGNDAIFTALQRLSNMNMIKLNSEHKSNCLHKWSLYKGSGPSCSEDLMRVMKCLQPLLNEALYGNSARGSSDVSQSVIGPLTWRQFHRMAGPTTKGRTDDQCEPLPVPAVTVGFEKEFVTLSPLALSYWEGLFLEPYSKSRDIAYIVISPDNELLLSCVKTFYKNLSNVYESCNLGRHVPITRVLRDGILKVSRNVASKLAKEEIDDQWFNVIGDSQTASLLRLYSKVCRCYLLPHLLSLKVDGSLLNLAPATTTTSASKLLATDKTTPSPSSPVVPSQLSTSNGLCNLTDSSTSTTVGGDSVGIDSANSEDSVDPPTIVIYIIDPFDSSNDCDMSSLGLLRCFAQMLPHLNSSLRHNIHLQVVSMDYILELRHERSARSSSAIRSLAFSVFSQAQYSMTYARDYKSLTGFGPVSNSEKFIKNHSDKAAKMIRLYAPAYILAESAIKHETSTAESMTLFCNYMLSENQRHLLATICDARGSFIKSVVINIEIPSKSKRRKVSARRVGLRKLMDWILDVMTMALVPWRLVIGRIGRLGHGELRGWSVLLGRKVLKRASRDLRDICAWSSDVPAIFSACLVSLEADTHLRLMTNQFTPDERFGKTANFCQLSTPKDISCSHIIVFPTSATAQSSQKDFEDQEEGLDATNNDLNDFGLDLGDMENDDDGTNMLGDFKDLFDDNNWGADVVGVGGARDNLSSPGRICGTDEIVLAGGNGVVGIGECDKNGSDSIIFRYGQELPSERIEILQQPLALGYLVSTAKTGPMPSWFWASCPHLKDVTPVFLKSSLHINVASVLNGGDEDGFAPSSASVEIHALDSSYTTDVLRYVLESYNALSWLSMDSSHNDRRSCLPVHVQILLQMYNKFSSLLP